MNSQEILLLVVNALLAIISGGLSMGMIFGSIELLGRYVALSGTAKRNLAPLVAMIAPVLAYGLLLVLTGERFEPATLCMAMFTGYVGATRIHDELERRDRADQTNAAPAQ